MRGPRNGVVFQVAGLWLGLFLLSVPGRAWALEGNRGPAAGSGASGAQGTLTEEGKAKAMPFFLKGNGLFERGEYLDALEAYQRAYSLYPSPKLLGNIASCYDQLGRYVKALEAYRRFLAETKGMESDPQMAANRRDAREAVGRLLKQVARLHVVVSVPGAKVFVAGLAALDAPLDRVFLFDPGKVTVSVTKKGYYPFQKVLSLASGAKTDVKVVLLQAIKPKVVVKVHVRQATPVWKKWWLWTAVGVAVSGAALGLGLWYGRREVDQSADGMYRDRTVTTSNLPVRW